MSELSNLNDEQINSLKRAYFNALPHTCNPSALIKCCDDEFRCESCHVLHLTQSHTLAVRMMWFKNYRPQDPIRRGTHTVEEVIVNRAKVQKEWVLLKNLMQGLSTKELISLKTNLEEEMRIGKTLLQ